jgi:hypothetical protein
MSSYNSDGGDQAILGVGNAIPSALMNLLLVDNLQPGDSPSYQACKTIYTDHPLGGKMAESPVKLAQSQKRIIQIPGSPEKELKEAFDNTWNSIGGSGADLYIRNTLTLSRVYGIASLAIGEDDGETEKPLDIASLVKKKIFFNVLDPLNTAGSLILNQNPNSAEFLKPTHIEVGSVRYHSSRTVIMMNEQPVYIQWTNSAFGFVGRSVYQRALYPLKSYVQSMITDNAITEKAAILVAKIKSPGSIIDQQSRSWFGFKRQAIKGAKTGNVISIGIDESIESIDLKNIRDAAEFARSDILKNIATAADMPASMINQETMAEGFGEGTEDAKNIARYIDGIRMDAAPLYNFFDAIVMRLAWNEEFYQELQRKYPEQYEDAPYETAFYQWKNAFIAEWPNLLTEPDSKKMEAEDVILKAAIGIYEVLSPTLDPVNRAAAAVWLADIVNDRKLLFSSHLQLDEELIAQYAPETVMAEPENLPESSRD